MAPQREVTDAGQLKWSCVQAYHGLNENERADTAADLVAEDNWMVTVVCTPGGRAQSVRVKLRSTWVQDLPDAELLAASARARR